MNKDPFDVMFTYWGGEVKGKPGGWAILYDERSTEINWYIRRLSGRKKPWRVLEATHDRQTGEFQRSGRPRFFKTEASAEKAILKMYEAYKKAREEKYGPFSEGSSSPAQQELIRARAKMIRKWFPDTTALYKQIELTGRTEEHDHALRKALISDCARLRRTPPDEIKNAVQLDKNFTAVLAKARTSSNPLAPMEEELALNWLAKYSGEGDGSYPSTMEEAIGTSCTSDAIKKRAQRLGLTVSSSKKLGQIT